MSKPRRRRRMTRVARARSAYFAGLLLLAAGLGWYVHPGLGIAVAGAGLIVWAVLLYDVDEEPEVREDGPW